MIVSFQCEKLCAYLMKKILSEKTGSCMVRMDWQPAPEGLAQIIPLLKVSTDAMVCYHFRICAFYVLNYWIIKEALQSVSKNQRCDVIKMEGLFTSFLRGFLFHFSSHPSFLWRHMADFLDTLQSIIIKTLIQ